MLTHGDIVRRVPHSGAMVLLETVVHWDSAHIVCMAPAPGSDHPMLREGRVSALVAIEYGAQAAAVHGSLIEKRSVPRPGMLAKVSDVRLLAAEIPMDQGPLRVMAQLLSRVTKGCLYDFEVAAAGQGVAQGRLMVAFATPAAR